MLLSSICRCLAVLLFISTVFDANIVVTATENDNNDTEDKEVHISPECAVVLIAAGGAIGGAATALALPSLGFMAAGVAKGSVAAWWQSTMPLVQAGSLFAALQSIAMTGGVGSTVIISGSIGGAATASKLTRLCEKIDKIDSNSQEGKVISTLLATQRKAGDLWSETFDPEGNIVKTWNGIKEQVSNIDLDPEGKISKSWSDIKDQVSNIDIDPNGNIGKMWSSMKDQASNIDLDPDGKIRKTWNDVKDQASNIELDPDGNIGKIWTSVKDQASKIELDPEGKIKKKWDGMKDELDPEGNIASFLSNIRQRAGF